jgi:hypothetical protein
MKCRTFFLVGILISLNACSSSSIEKDNTYRESELRKNQVVKSLPTACHELKKSVESKQAQLREVLDFDRNDNDESTVLKRKENIARLNNEIMIMIIEYKRTCVAPVEG